MDLLFKHGSESIPLLSSAFSQSSRQCREETREFKSALSQRSELLPLPLWEPHKWPGRIYRKNRDSNNCYNFAINTRTNISATPGMFSEGPLKSLQTRNIELKHASIHKGALRDGLVFLGESFSGACAKNLNPVALFMREPLYPEFRADYHWVALRRKLNGSVSWAHVPGYGAAAETIGPLRSIFDAAGKHKYNFFSGFYGIPAGKIFDPIHDEKDPIYIPQPR